MFTAPYISTTVSLVAQTVKNRPAMQETVVLSLGQEDPLETRRATHSSIVSWRISRTEEQGGLLYGVTKNQDRTEQLTLSLFIYRLCLKSCDKKIKYRKAELQ